jgi:hypothetical protein
VGGRAVAACWCKHELKSVRGEELVVVWGLCAVDRCDEEVVPTSSNIFLFFLFGCLLDRYSMSINPRAAEGI